MKILVIGQQKFGETTASIFSKIPVEVKIASDEAGIQSGLSSHASVNLVLLDGDFFKSREDKIFSLLRQIRKTGKPVVFLSSRRVFSYLLKIKNSGVTDYLLKPYNERELVMRVNAVLQKKIRVTCIGGGTGLFHLLIGLKTMPHVLLTSVVSMSDDGGSSGKLSRSLGLLPPGDIRRSLVALSNAPDIMNQIMQYRFDKKGELGGHSFGNIFLAALAGVKGTMSEAVRSLSDILYLQGIVLPASRTRTKLVATFENGAVIKGESKIDRAVGRAANLRIASLRHEPESEADADAVAAILFSDYITIGPGDLYTSIVTNLAIRHIRDAILASHGKKIYICNLMTKPGETSGFDAADHVEEIVKYLGRDSLDFVLISNTKLSRQAITDYRKKDQVPVDFRNTKNVKSLTAAKIIAADIGDTRELVRHDSAHLRTAIQKIIGAAS